MSPQLVSRYKGVQLGEKSQAALSAVLDAGANCIRYQIVTSWDNPALKDAPSYRLWLDSELLLLDNILQVQSASVFGVIDLHTPPGGISLDGDIFAMFSNRADEQWTRQCFIDTWSYLANRYKDNTKIKVYGILNEPRSLTVEQTVTTMQTGIAAIRTYDVRKYIVITGRYSAPETIRTLKEVVDPKLWYEFHMYDPISFTHQGIYEFPAGQVYPSVSYPKSYVYARLKSVRDFQLKWDLKTVYVGEFSCDTFADADSRFRYLNDLTGKFEEYGWNYCYHAWREAPVWNMEDDARIFNMFKARWNLG